MSVSITDKVKKEIADFLEMGMLCFYHLPTGELEYYPDELRGNAGFDEEVWQESIDKVENNYHEYIRFEGMESHESFRIMEAFVDSIADAKARQRFTDAISFRKPFQNFKQLLNNYPELRQQWFQYKSQHYQAWVQEQVDDYNSRITEE